MRIERDHGESPPADASLPRMYQLFSFAMLIALMTNNLGILWVAMEVATLTTVLLVSLYRTPTASRRRGSISSSAAWDRAGAVRHGTALLRRRTGAGREGDALLWTNLNGVTDQLDPTVMRLAFVFLLVGYGTKVGLVPLHNWLPDAHSEGPTPVSAVLSGLLLNIALYALIRCKALVDGSLGSGFAGNIMMGFGLLSVLTASFSCCARRTSSACSPIPPSSTWGSPPLPSASAGRSPPSAGCSI